MIESEAEVRVRYGETDQMGYVYYGIYAQYFEVGRVEAMRKVGWSYKKIEDAGIMLPVLEFKVKYYKPAYYDDVLKIVTRIPLMPSVRIKFDYEIYNSKNEKLNDASTTLVFINKKNRKPCQPPQDFLNDCKSFFS